MQEYVNQKIKLDREKSQAECFPVSQSGLCEIRKTNKRVIDPKRGILKLFPL